MRWHSVQQSCDWMLQVQTHCTRCLKSNYMDWTMSCEALRKTWYSLFVVIRDLEFSHSLGCSRGACFSMIRDIFVVFISRCEEDRKQIYKLSLIFTALKLVEVKKKTNSIRKNEKNNMQCDVLFFFLQINRVTCWPRTKRFTTVNF